jgi:chromosome segregation ATPase
MISLDQIQKLEARVNQAVELIKSLKAENQSLRSTLDSAQSRMQELEELVGEFKSDQQEIEQCIVRALENLDELEDEIGENAGGKDAGQAAAAAGGPGVQEEPRSEGSDREEEGDRTPASEAASETATAESAGQESADDEGSPELDIF